MSHPPIGSLCSLPSICLSHLRFNTTRKVSSKEKKLPSKPAPIPAFPFRISRPFDICVTFVVLADCESCTRPISTNPGIYGGSGRVWTNAWDVFRRTPSRGGRGRRDAADFVGYFGCGGISNLFFSLFFFFGRTRPAASMKSPCLIYLSTS